MFLFCFCFLTVLGLSCGMWDLVSQSGIEPGPPALGAQSLSHWNTREVLQGQVLWKTIFSMEWGTGDGCRMLQVHYIYCALYFYYYYISSTSDHQALDPGAWGLPS